MHRLNQVIYLTCWTIAIHILTSACTDFSQFNCFNSEMGCAEQSVAGEVSDSEASQAGFPQPEITSLAGSEQTPSDAQCYVDQLDICETCDINGSVELAPNDQRCERIECLDQYRLEEAEGMLRCIQKSRAATSSGFCYQRGLCHTEETLCTEISTGLAQEVAKASCYTIVGCMGSTPPRLVSRPNCHQ